MEPRIESSTPVAVSGITTAVAVDVGGDAACAVLSDGTGRCWGTNTVGQLGDGTTTDSPTPVAVSGISTAVAVAAGSIHFCARLSSGGIRCWGGNPYGQLGDGTTTDTAVSVGVTGLPTAMEVTGGNDLSCAGLLSGLFDCWGNNHLGELGNGGSTASSTPVVVTLASVSPGPPTAPLAVPGSGQASVSWTAPVGITGSAVTGFTVTSSPGGKTCSSLGALTCTVSSLTNGTAYTFTVRATNGVGSGPVSSPSNSVTPATVPGAPTMPMAAAGDSSALVGWSAPASTGGSPIIGYTVTSSPGARSCTSTGSLSCHVTGLTNGTAYTFTVRATNGVGSGPVSSPSNSVTPGPLVVRYAGASRFSTAAAISAHTFDPGAPVAYIANAFNFPDALAGAAAAGTVKGPVLLAAATGALDPATVSELARLKPLKIIVLGGTGSISAAVMTSLVPYATSHVVVRYAGASRFSTAAAISAHTFDPGAPVAYIANAFNFPDALAGAAAAGTVKGPVLLAAATGALDPATVSELARLKPLKIIVLGGTGSISAAVMTSLVPYATSHVVVRYAGASRFSTAAAISAHTFDPGAPVAYIANAFNFPDALAGAAAAGTVKGPVLLAAATGALDPATVSELARLKPLKIIVLGGTGSISAAVMTSLVPYALGP